VFLKSIAIYGFKTFAEKTQLVFKPGVTAIVGPNGCGKSNVVDAIRWVLGEANARSLRGEVMEDIIFSGSEEKKPLGMAEVGLTVVNDDNLLPIEYSEVTVKRRLYRSGESESFINKNNVRLKDVHELFADTGIGKTAYSVMEQGNIDLILSNKPEERMMIFEEAAGITRYKMRIKESYKMLAAADENLGRLNLIISEVEKEYKNLEKQAEKAVTYKSLKKEEVALETLYNYARVQDLKQEIKENSAKLDDLLRSKAELAKEMSALNEMIKRDIERVREIEAEIIEIKKEIYKKEADIETIHLKISHRNERIREVDLEISKKERLVLESLERKNVLRENIKQLVEYKKRTHELILSQQEKLSGYKNEIAQMNEHIYRNAETVQENTSEIEVIDETLVTLRDELKKVIDRLLYEIDVIKTKFTGNEKKKNELIKRVDKSIQEINSILKHHGTKLQDLSYGAQGSGFHHLVKELEEEAHDLRERMNDLRSNIGAVITIQDDLSRVLFGKESIHSKKEEIEKSIDTLLAQAEDLKNENAALNEEIKKNREKKEKYEEIINGILPDNARNREKEKHYDENITRLSKEQELSEEYVQDIEFEIHTLEERKTGFQSDISRMHLQHKGIEKEKTALTKKANNQNTLINTLLSKIHRNELKLDGMNKRDQKIVPIIETLEIKNAETKSKIETIHENFKERYSTSLELFHTAKKIDMTTINEKRVAVKDQIASLGQVNLIAIEEFNEVKKRYDYLSAQRADLEKAKEDLHLIVSKTLKSSKELFMESFEKIKLNFNNLFRRLFNGGRTDLYLTNEENIFETGVEIMACPPGKSLKRRSLLSGGEKSLTAIALLFSIFMVRPSPFCMLDEVDHDLDEENVLRFLKLLKEFTETTQFIIITHNRRTIEFADVIYGVTTEQAGISKVVSLEMMEHAVE